jgi:hypothetical protein
MTNCGHHLSLARHFLSLTLPLLRENQHSFRSVISEFVKTLVVHRKQRLRPYWGPVDANSVLLFLIWVDVWIFR